MKSYDKIFNLLLPIKIDTSVLIVLFLVNMNTSCLNARGQIDIRYKVTESGEKKADIKSGGIEDLSQESWRGLDSDSLKIWVPALTSILALIVTNIIVLYKITRDSSESIKKELIVAKIKFDRERLEKFYDPMYTLLTVNSGIFTSFGPHTFRIDNGALSNEAAELWKQMVQNIVLPNNARICEIIKTYSHLLAGQDNLDNYIDFLKHAESYSHFIKFPNERHSAHKYPVQFLEQVKINRMNVINILTETEKKLT